MSNSSPTVVDPSTVRIQNVIKSFLGSKSNVTERNNCGNRPTAVEKKSIADKKTTRTIVKYPKSNLRLLPNTSYLLLSRNGPAFDVVDRPFPAIPNFHVSLFQELKRNGVLEKLSPAKTTSERKLDSIQKILSSSGFNSETLDDGIRGDVSTFVLRNERADVESFNSRHPFLSDLINGIEIYVENELSHSFSFDFSMTSVQVAQFAGDGRGYIRHCDEGARCKHESSHYGNSVGGGGGVTNKRVITVVYYVGRDEDIDSSDVSSSPTVSSWREEYGGCLRMFLDYDHDGKSILHPSEYGGEGKRAINKTLDIEPFPGRLVIFRSGIVEHSVLPCYGNVQRTAVTVWIYGMEITTTNRTNDLHSPPIMLPRLVSRKCDFLETRSDRSIPLCLNKASSELDINSTIFVSIASYCDSELLPTMFDMINKALAYERISIGVVLQHDDDDNDTKDSIMSTLTSYFGDDWVCSNIRILSIHRNHATGPCWARSLAQRLARGEEFVLQIDSHMRFRANWDVYLLQQIKKCDSLSILTTYPLGYNFPNNIPADTRATLLVPSVFDKNNLLRQKSRIISPSINASMYKTNDNIPSTLWAAGFNFGPKSSMKDVPYDDNLPELFFGEELSMALRLSSYGYKFFAPPESVCYHLWSRDHRPTFQNTRKINIDSRRISKNRSIDIVKNQLLGHNREGMGPMSIADTNFARGVDFVNHTISKEARNGFLPGHIFEAKESMISDGNDTTDELYDLVMKVMKRV